MIGGMFPIIHLGRAWLFFWLLRIPTAPLWPNFRSLLWDSTAIVTHVTGSVIYLYMPPPRHGATGGVQNAVAAHTGRSLAGPAATANGTRWSAP
jgi:hypothetical protein